MEELLDRLGKREAPGLEIVLSDDELSRLREALPRAMDILEPVQANVAGELRGIRLPHELPPELREASGEAASPKAALTSALEPLGYSLSGSGRKEVAFTKAFASHNQATVRIGLSPRPATLARPACTDVAVSFGYGGPLWFCPVMLNVTPRQEAQPVAVSDQETMVKVVQNAAAVVRYLESELVPLLDELYGSAPAWYGQE